jgi:hypothetical protein
MNCRCELLIIGINERVAVFLNEISAIFYRLGSKATTFRVNIYCDTTAGSQVHHKNFIAERLIFSLY